MKAPESSGRRAGLICALTSGAFLLVIMNWRSPIGMRSSSGNVDLLVFSLAVTVLPLLLFWSARRLEGISSAVFSAVALCMLVFSALVWVWNFHSLGFIVRGMEVQPLLASVPFGNGRVAAYEVETAPAGAYVALRLQYRVIPGLVVSREFAVIDTPNIDKLILVPPAGLCVTFPSLQVDASSNPNELSAVLPIEPLFQHLNATTVIEPMADSAVKSGADCGSGARTL